MKAALTGNPTPATGSPFSLSISVDLTGMTGTGPSGSTPVVLGGYQIAINFNKANVQFVSATGGTTNAFSSAPVFTDPATANNNGKVIITAAQSGSAGPTGLVNVASVSFTATAAGATSFSVSAVSLSSAFQPPSFGPASIPSAGTSVSVTVYRIPAAPVLVSPASGEKVNPPVTLTWTGNPDATSYQVYFGSQSANLAGIVTAPTTSLSVATVAGTQYMWKVVAVNPAGSTSSAIQRFTTTGTAPCNAPGVPLPTSPSSPVASGSTIQVSWGAVSGASEYHMQESTDSAFTSPSEIVVQAPATSATFTHVVTQATTYYYRVAAAVTGTCTATSAFSSPVSVVVNAPVIFQRVVLAAASSGGALGSFFRTSMQLFNPGSDSLTGTIAFHPAGQTASASDPSMQYSVPPGQIVAYSDVVAAMNATGLGTMDLTSTGAFPVTFVRVYDDGGSLGTTGLAEELLAPQDALQTGDTTALFAPGDTVAARTNIGYRTLSAGATIQIVWRSASGATVKTLSKTLPPNTFNQMTDAAFLESPSPLSSNDSVTVSVTAGSLFLYESETDNKTQDPTLFVGHKVN